MSFPSIMGCVIASSLLAPAVASADCASVIGGYRCAPGNFLASRWDGYTDWRLVSVGAPTAGVYTLEATSDDKVDFCKQCNPATVTLTTTASTMESDAITTSTELGLTVGVNAEFNVAAAAKMGVKVEENFKLGKQNMSTVTEMVSHTVSGQFTGPPKRIQHLRAEIWGLHSRTAVGTFAHDRKYALKCCPLNGQGSCSDWINITCSNGETGTQNVSSPKSCLSRARKEAVPWEEACPATPPGAVGTVDTCEPSPSPSPTPDPDPSPTPDAGSAS